VNQRLNGGNWVSLGTYNFNSGTGGNVTLNHTPAGTNDTACVDAMRFVQPIQTIDVKNAHYYTWYDANGNGAINPGEVYLVNIDGGTLTYYQFTDADGDNIIDRNELLAVAGNNPPAAVLTGRTYTEERQNFANWYSFYRRRELTATAAVSKSIASMQGVKIGINSINHRIVQPVLSIKVGAVDQTSTLLNSLYGMVLQANSTPLRLGLREVGRYFDADDGQTGGLGSSPFAAAADGGESSRLLPS
jgi:type IV pilus assembly protein PilY1